MSELDPRVNATASLPTRPATTGGAVPLQIYLIVHSFVYLHVEFNCPDAMLDQDHIIDRANEGITHEATSDQSYHFPH